MGKHKNAAQNNIMIEFMSKHWDLARGFPQGDSANADVLWKKLSDKLNNKGPPYRTVTAWQKTWNDWKNDVRKKLHSKQINDNADYSLSSIDEGVARVAGFYETVDGLFALAKTNSRPASEASTPESTFEFDPDDIKQEEMEEEETKIVQEALNDAAIVDFNELEENVNLDVTASSSMKHGSSYELNGTKRKVPKLEKSIKHTSMSDESESEIVETPNIYEIKMKVRFGEYKIIPNPGKSKVWNIFGRIDKGGSIIENLVACMLCNSVFSYNHASTSNLVKHKCYRMNEVKPKRDASNETKNFYQHESESESSEIMSTVDCSKVCDIKVKIQNGEYKIVSQAGKSKVWRVFGRVDRGGSIIENVVACMLCNSVCSFNNSTTSNLVKHKCYRNLNEDKPKVEVDNDTKNDVVRAITEWLIRDCRPVTLIEDDGFKQFVNLMISIGAKHGANVQVDVDKILPQHTSILKRIEDFYDSNYASMRLELNELLDNGFGLTADLWSYDLKEISHLTLIIHFIKNAKICNKLIALKSMESAECNSERITRKLKAILQQFNSNLDKALILTNYDSPIKIMNHHIICIKYLLNDVFGKSLEENPNIKELCLDCTNLVKYFHKSEVNEQLAVKLQNSCETNDPLSIFFLLQVVQNNWTDIVNVLKEKNEFHRVANINVDIMDAVIKILKNFDDTSKELTSENIPTLHLTIVHIYFLRRVCSTKNNNDSCIIKTWKGKLVTLLNELISNNLTIFHKIALFLFPPTSKLTQFTNVEKDDIKTQCKKMMEEFTYEPNLFEQNEIEQPQTESLSSANELLFSGFIQSSNLNLSNIVDQAQHELIMYESVNEVMHNNFDVLQWWEFNKQKYPLLYKLSCKILATPASGVLSKRVASSARQLLTEQYCSLDLNFASVEKVLFLHSNARE